MRHANRFLEQVIKTLVGRGESYGSPNAVFENVAKRWSLTLGVEVDAALHGASGISRWQK